MQFIKLSDEELMLKYQGGDEHAFAELYKRLSPRIFGYFHSKIRTKEKTEEAFQEFFIKLHKSKHLYKKGMPILPWVFTIARTVFLDEVRRTKFEKNQVQISDGDWTTENNFKDEGKQELQPVLSKLSPEQKSALELRYFDEKTFDEIAIILNTNSANIRQIVSRGVKKLKEILSGGSYGQ